MKIAVVLKDGTSRSYPLEVPGSGSGSGWHQARVEAGGALTIYQCWDGGVAIGQRAIASFANELWSKWEMEKE